MQHQKNTFQQGEEISKKSDTSYPSLLSQFSSVSTGPRGGCQEDTWEAQRGHRRRADSAGQRREHEKDAEEVDWWKCGEHFGQGVWDEFGNKYLFDSEKSLIITVWSWMKPLYLSNFRRWPVRMKGNWKTLAAISMCDTTPTSLDLRGGFAQNMAFKPGARKDSNQPSTPNL